jgi:hypothetical protein
VNSVRARPGALGAGNRVREGEASGRAAACHGHCDDRDPLLQPREVPEGCGGLCARADAPVDEILILNDCSTDDFRTVAQQFTDPRIKLMAFDVNRGMAEAHNQMAYRAKGDFIVYLSADDTLAPTYVEKCLGMFKAHPWLEFVASQNDFMDEAGAAVPEG